MKKRKLIPALALTLALLCGITIGATASNGIQKIQADLDPTISVKLNGETQILKDAQGSRIYPITYQGNTYLPIRAVAGLAGLGVDWDQATRSVLLGDPAEGVDLIDTYKNYYSGWKTGQVQTADKKTEDISGITCSHWLYMDAWNDNDTQISFNLLGKHKTLTFSYYSDRDVTLQVLGDNGYVLGEYQISGTASAKTVTVSLLNTNELTFHAVVPGAGILRIFNAYLDAE